MTGGARRYGRRCRHDYEIAEVEHRGEHTPVPEAARPGRHAAAETGEPARPAGQTERKH